MFSWLEKTFRYIKFLFCFKSRDNPFQQLWNISRLLIHARPKSDHYLRRAERASKLSGMKEKTTSFHLEVRKRNADFDQLRNSCLNIGHVCECWLISRNFSRPTIFCVHNNQILANMQTKFGNFIFKTLSIVLFWRDVVVTFWYGHKFPPCKLSFNE